MSFKVLTTQTKQPLNEKVNILSSPRTLGYSTKQKLADALGLEFDPACSVKREDIDVVIVSENPHPVPATQAFIDKSLANGKVVLTFDDVKMILDGSKKLSDFGNISTINNQSVQEITPEPTVDEPEVEEIVNNVEPKPEQAEKPTYNSSFDGSMPDLAQCLGNVVRCRTRLRHMLASDALKFNDGLNIPIAAIVVPQEYESEYGMVRPGNGEKYYMPIVADSTETYDVIRRLWCYCHMQDLTLGEICTVEEVPSKTQYMNVRAKHLIYELELIRKENDKDPRIKDSRYFTARILEPTKQYRISGIIDGEMEPVLVARIDQVRGMYIISASALAKDRIAKIQS